MKSALTLWANLEVARDELASLQCHFGTIKVAEQGNHIRVFNTELTLQ